ncbi:hypothetical protein ACJZL1_02075 [Wolbachia endosymbiont of Rhagoletis indifferens]|uniref:hypothetical protein n=1 Tax=Wolbachia endosymbiont of Rhagoletis indifferens TaxID=3383250 RepID=UPI003AF33E4A
MLAAKIPQRHDVEAILLYSPTQLDPSSQSTGMTMWSVCFCHPMIGSSLKKKTWIPVGFVA